MTEHILPALLLRPSMNLLLLRNDDKGDQSLTFYRNSAKYNVP